MSQQRVRKQISAILEANSLTWTDTSTGGMYLRFSSAGVSIEIGSWGAQTLIQISSNVLSRVEAEPKRAYKEVNGLNAASEFAGSTTRIRSLSRLSATPWETISKRMSR
jgi:hypothetical protein